MTTPVPVCVEAVLESQIQEVRVEGDGQDIQEVYAPMEEIERWYYAKKGHCRVKLCTTNVHNAASLVFDDCLELFQQKHISLKQVPREHARCAEAAIAKYM